MYRNLIRETMVKLGKMGEADPRHVEAWMRLEKGTLDALSPAAFHAEIVLALGCIAAAPIGESETLAASYGL